MIKIPQILLFSANPKDTQDIRLSEEVREISKRLERYAGYGNEPIKLWQAARSTEIQQAILECKPKIVHFSGHGAGKQGLSFEDASGLSKLVSSRALAALFELVSDQVECVLLNACYSQTQAEAIAQHIDFVIGMSDKIGNQAAIAFSTGFYTALGTGQCFEKAYQFGCNSIEIENIPEEMTPVLYKRGKLFEGFEKIKFIKKSDIYHHSESSVREQSDPYKPEELAVIDTEDPRVVETRQHQIKTSKSLRSDSRGCDSSQDNVYKENAEDVGIEIINRLMNILKMTKEREIEKKLMMFLHESLVCGNSMNIRFKKINIEPSIKNAVFYETPVNISSIRSTERTRIGSRKKRQFGQKKIYQISRNEDYRGVFGYVRIFFPSNLDEPRISGISL